LKKKLEQLLTKVAENESIKIIENLGKENFFNMSENQVNKEVTEYLMLQNRVARRTKEIRGRNHTGD
jgi:hypothetical protein